MCQNEKVQIVFLDSCPPQFKSCMVLTYIKKIRHSILCVTDVSLGDINMIFFLFNFALECDLSQSLLFLF